MNIDTGKLSEMEAGSGIDMELQSDGDGGSSSKENTNANIKMNGSNIPLLRKAGGRHSFSAQLVRQLGNAGINSSAAENWSHHRFVLDDGNAVNVAVRQAEGAMQLQLSAGNSELNKIIQQHIDEIRQHLQEHMELEIDLQLQNFGKEQAGQGGDSKENTFGSQETKFGSTTEHQQEEPKTGNTAVRYLGFNNNEWTA